MSEALRDPAAEAPDPAYPFMLVAGQRRMHNANQIFRTPAWRKSDPDGGVPQGTAFEDIPDDWFCPVCGARKRDFTPYEG